MERSKIKYTAGEGAGAREGEGEANRQVQQTVMARRNGH